MRSASRRFRIAIACLVLVGVAIGGFGVVAAMVPPAGDKPLMRADGVASIGVGLFGVLITICAFRFRQRWAWWALWFYPVFWSAHLIGRLPPGKDHVHQVALLVLSLAGLLVPAREFFPRKAKTSTTDESAPRSPGP